jgi:hypothetical protein
MRQMEYWTAEYSTVRDGELIEGEMVANASNATYWQRERERERARVDCPTSSEGGRGVFWAPQRIYMCHHNGGLN